MNNDKKIHGVFKITPITPIHISDGEKHQIFEYYIENKNFYLKDVFKFFQENYQNLDTALKIIEDLSFRPSPEYIRYTLPVFANPKEIQKTTSVAHPKSGGYPKSISPKHTNLDPSMAKIMKEAEKKQQQSTPQPVSTPRPSAPVSQPTEEVFSFIKDPFGQPFIPGSSLKGCLRTAILYYLLCKNPKPFQQIKNQKTNPKKAAEPIQILHTLQEDPNSNFNAKYDLFKVLVIRDSKPISITDHFAVCQININVKKENTLNVVRQFAECMLPQNKPIEIEFYIDKLTLNKLTKEISYINKDIIEESIKVFSVKDGFRNALFEFSQALYRSQEDFFKTTNSLDKIPQTLKDSYDKKQIILQIGFNTGYKSKTVILAASDKDQLEIRKKYRLGYPKSKHEIENPFPKSLKLVSNAFDVGPSVPLGWFKLEIEWQ